MVLWQGTPLMSILGSKRCFVLRNRWVFILRTNKKIKGWGAKVASHPKRVNVNLALVTKLKSRLVGATKTNPA